MPPRNLTPPCELEWSFHNLTQGLSYSDGVLADISQCLA